MPALRQTTLNAVRNGKSGGWLVLLCVVAWSGPARAAEAAPAAAEPLGSVAELPVEKFDQYPAGGPPPEPWQLAAPLADGVSVTLAPEAESPFIGNKVNGVGVQLSDASATAGADAGLRYPFAPPPPGPLFLAFDFKVDAGGEAVRPTVALQGDGAWTLLLVRGGQMGLLGADGAFQALAEVKPDTWYHLALQGDSAGGPGWLGLVAHQTGRPWGYYLSLRDKPENPKKAAYDVWTEVTLPPLGAARALVLANTGEASAQGTWRFDNLLTAGRIDAPRENWWPHRLPPLASLRAAPKKVFAYYFPVYTSDNGSSDPGVGFAHYATLNPQKMPWEKPCADYRQDGYAGYQLFQHLPHVPRLGLNSDECRARAREEDVRVARAIGLDGFFVDFWTEPHQSNGEATFSKDSFALLDAASAVDPEFKIVLAFYVGGGAKKVDGVPDPHAYAASPLLQQALRHPAAFRFPDGKVALSSWLAERYSVEWWRTVLADLEQAGFQIAFLPHFNSLNRLEEFAPLARGMAKWGTHIPGCDREWPALAHKYVSLAISPLGSQDVRVRGRHMWEAHNSESFRRHWEDAINENADWVIFNTWTDYSEQAQMPSTRIGYAFYDLNAYYIPWFKTGQPPAVERDVLYYFYRRQHTDTPPALGKPWTFANYDPKTGQSAAAAPRNEIELLAFLKTPGRLVIQAGGERHVQDAPAGMTSFKVPLPKTGEFRPEFALERDGQIVLAGQGHYLITDRVVFTDLLYNAGVIAGQ